MSETDDSNFWDGVTDYARQALRAALLEAQSRGSPQVEPEHLLLGTMDQGEGTAYRVLRRLGVRRDALAAAVGGRDPESWCALPALSAVRARLSPATLRLLEQARAEATRARSPLLGTEHLLLALLADAEGRAEGLLSRCGFTLDGPHAREELARALTASGERTERLPRPRVVAAAGFLLLSQLFCAAPGFGLAFVSRAASADDAPAGFGSLVLGAQVVWTLVACGWYYAPFMRGERWAWSAVVALLFVKSASGVAALVALAVVATRTSGSSGELVPWLLLAGYALAMPAFTLGLFDARGWYGIGRRDGWRALRTEGRWHLLTSASVELAGIAAVAFYILSARR